MLTSFFAKSSPLHFLLVGSYLFLILGINFVIDAETNFTSEGIGMFPGVLALLIFSILLLDFMIRKNTLTHLNAFSIFVFACSAAMLPEIFKMPAIVVSSVLLLLAVRRMFSLQSPKNAEIKILDASLWIGLASLFYFWSFLFLIALYMAIFLKPLKNVRYLLIPVVGIVGLFLIVTAFYFMYDNSFSWFLDWLETISLDFSSYAKPQQWIFVTIMGALIIWTTVSIMADISKGPRKDKPNNILKLYVLAVSVLLVLVSSEKSGAEFLFLIAPAAIIISNFIEKKTEIWFKEILMWIFLLLPIVFIFL